MNEMNLKIDYREKSIIPYFQEYNPSIVNLLVGDIVCKNVAIERKSTGDLISSIIDMRLRNQAINLKNNYNKPYILVESDLPRIQKYLIFNHFNINMEQVIGITTSIMIRQKVPIIFCSTRKNFVKVTKKLIEKGTDEKNDNEIIFVKKKKVEPKVAVLMSIPGIGQKKAVKILEHYKTFDNLTKMDKPKGITENDIKNILEVLS